MSISLNECAVLLISQRAFKTYIEGIEQRPATRWRNNL